MAVDLAEPISIGSPCLLMHAVADRRVGWMAAPIAPPLVGIKPRAAHYARDCTHTVIGTGQRPKQVDVPALSDGCDLRMLPAVPASLDTDGLVLTRQALQGIGDERGRRQRRS
jgi:hypothetical protein